MNPPVQKPENAQLRARLAHAAEAYYHLSALDNHLHLGDIVDEEAQSLLREHLKALRAACQGAPARTTDPATADRVSVLESALAALIARIRTTGGYASPEEQDVLRWAERVLAGAQR